MLNKNNITKLAYLLIILLSSIICNAEGLPELPLAEKKMNEDERIWDYAQDIFDNAAQPLSIPEKNNIKDEASLVINIPNPNIQNDIVKEDQPNNQNIIHDKVDKKAPIGRTNTFVNSNFKKKSTPEYGKYKLMGENKNLPPIYFESNLVSDAFNAVKNNDINNLRYLIKNYDLENFVDQFGNNLLLVAAQEKKVNVLRMLLVNLYDINFLNIKKMTALHIAVANQDMQMIKTLLTMKIDINLKDINNKTALDYAKEINSEIADFIVTYLK